MQSPLFPVTSSLLGPNILLNAMFSNTLSFLSSRSVNNQVTVPNTLKFKKKTLTSTTEHLHLQVVLPLSFAAFCASVVAKTLQVVSTRFPVKILIRLFFCGYELPVFSSEVLGESVFRKGKF